MGFNVLDGLQTYGGKWEVKETMKFSQNDLNNIESARVVDSPYGSSCCLFLKSGRTAFIPMASNSKLNIGDAIDPTKAKILVLERAGEDDIKRLIEE